MAEAAGSQADTSACGVPRAISGRVRIILVLLAHYTIDFISFVIIPLMPILEGRLALTPGQTAMLLGAGSVSSGLIQPLAALYCDKYSTRAPAWFGLIAAGASIGLVGHVGSFWQLLAIQVIGTAGIGAFHPPAAAVVGHLAGARRSTAIAMFYISGMLGGVSGNALSPRLVKWTSIESLLWLIAPALIAAVVVYFAIARVEHGHGHARDSHRALPARERSARWGAIVLLYLGNATRFIVNMMMVHLLIRWALTRELTLSGEAVPSEAVRDAASQVNGWLQASMQVGMAVGGLLSAFVITPRLEKRALVLVPLLGAVAIMFVPSTGVLVPAMLLSIVAGLGFGGVLPVTMSLAQRLLPHRTSLATGLMLGGAWSVAAIGPTLAQWLIDGVGQQGAFNATARLLAASALLSLLLPGALIIRTAETDAPRS